MRDYLICTVVQSYVELLSIQFGDDKRDISHFITVTERSVRK